MLKFFRKMFKNDLLAGSFWQLLERGINMFIAFFVTLYLIRILGPDKYGILSYAQSYVFLFSALTTMGLQSIVVRELVKKELPVEEVLGSAFFIMFCGSVLMVIICAGSSCIYQGFNLSFWMVLLISGSNIFLSLNVISFYFQAIIKTKYTAMALLFQDFIDGGGKLIFIFLGLPLIFLGILYLFEVGMMVTMLLIIYIKRASKLKKWAPSKNTIFFLLKSSFPLAVSGAMVALYGRFDFVMLEYYQGSSSVGIYAAGTKLIELTYMLPMILIPNLLPFFVKFSRNQLLFNFRIISFIIFWFTILICIVASLCGKKLIFLIFGSNYNEASIVFLISIWSIIFVFQGIAKMLYLIPNNLQKYMMFFTLIGLPVCILFNIYLIPKYGVVGACIATLIADFMSIIVSNIFFKQTRPLFLIYIFSPFYFKEFCFLIKKRKLI